MVHRLAGDGSLWIGGLIRLMSSFGVSPPAVRQAVSRMSRQGWLTARRRGNRAFYAVTERGRRRIEELSPRIYGPVIEWDGRWRVLSYAIGEEHRKRRERLRKELNALGWATLAPSTWISPSGLARRRARSRADGADARCNRSLQQQSTAGRPAIESCSNDAGTSTAIASAYTDFIARYRTALRARTRARRPYRRGGAGRSGSGSSTTIASSPISIPDCRASCSPHIGPGPQPPRCFASTMRCSTPNHNATFIFARARRTGASRKASKRPADAQTSADSSRRRRARNCCVQRRSTSADAIRRDRPSPRRRTRRSKQRRSW